MLTKEQRVEIMNKARAVKMEKNKLKTTSSDVPKKTKKQLKPLEIPEPVEAIEIVEPVKIVKPKKVKKEIEYKNLDVIPDKEPEYTEVVVEEEVIPAEPKKPKKKIIKKVIQEVHEESSEDTIEYEIEQRIIPKPKKQNIKPPETKPIPQKKPVVDGFSLFDY
jgi:hypothetical protein